MPLQHSDAYKSILPHQLDGIELPNFAVITGENGSGKTHLLQGLAAGHIHLTELRIDDQKEIRLVEAGALRISEVSELSNIEFREYWKSDWERIPTLLHRAFHPQSNAADVDPDDPAAGALVINQVMSADAVERLKRGSGKRLIQELTEDDYFLHGPLLTGREDLLGHQIGEVFLKWAMRRKGNRYRELSAQRDGSTVPWMTEGEFIQRFGGAPWEALNLVLRRLHLPYQYPAPSADDSGTYVALLRHDHGYDVHPSDLSGGEQTLLAIAQSLYTSTALLANTRLPKCMLFDEPDATLHPVMVQDMLDVFEQTFVAEHQMRVVITTHSPSTVALAPEQSLLVMNSATPRLAAVSTHEAVQALTVGIPTLSVRVEKQRQIFVESMIDQQVYQQLFTNLQRVKLLETDLTPVFIASGTGDDDGGAGAARVKELVSKMRTNDGVTTVFGIIDKDNGSGNGSATIKIVNDRWAIENLIADPLLVGTMLLKRENVSAENLGLPASVRAVDLCPEHAQPIIDAVAAATGMDSGDKRAVEYSAGFTAQVPSAWLDTKGMDVLNSVIQSYAALHQYSKQQKNAPTKTPDSLMKELAREAAADFPGFIPMSLLRVFKTILS